MILRDLLESIANTAIEIEHARRDYSVARQEHFKRYPLWTQRDTEQARREWAEASGPITERKKELGRKLRGYLFMYEQREFQ